MLPQAEPHFFICSAILTVVPRDAEGCLREPKLRRSVLASVICAAAALSAGSDAARAQAAGSGAAELVLSAIGLLGTPYRYGGDRPSSGFDCSGLVRYVAGSVLGVELPRRAEAISRAGVEVQPRRLQPGDLVFFNTLGRPYSHVGFYVGDGQFIHAPARRGEVRIETMAQPYWRNRFNGARRLEALPGPEAEAKPTEAGSGLRSSADFPSIKVEP